MAQPTIEDLISTWEPRLQAAFLQSIYRIRDQADLAAIATMIQRGDIEGAIRAVGLNPAQFRPLDQAIGNAFEAGADLTATGIPAALSGGGARVHFQFSIRNPEAEDWLRSYSSTLVKEIIDDQRAAVRGFLTANLAAGSNPRDVAMGLVGRVSKATGHREGGIIGLTASQEQWVRNYRAELEGDNPIDALQRVLRDKRFDRTVLKAENDGERIPPALIDKMVTAYKNRALRYRAETIGRKETITALHTAQEQAMLQAVAAGNVNPKDVSYIWRTAHDKRVRETHIPMDGQTRPMGQPFTTGAGVHLMYPGDPNGPAGEVINCRCWREPKINFLARLKK